GSRIAGPFVRTGPSAGVLPADGLVVKNRAGRCFQPCVLFWRVSRSCPLYTSITGKQASSDPILLVDLARQAGVLPSDAFPLLNQAAKQFAAGPATMFDADAQLRRVLREMFSAVAWAGSRLIRRSVTGAGFTVWEPVDINPDWASDFRGFFAQRSHLTLLVAPVFSRASLPQELIEDQAAFNLLSAAYKTMRKTPGYAERLPVPVVVHTAAAFESKSHTVRSGSYAETPDFHEFSLPLGDLNALTTMLVEVFGANS
ncbi:MAG TPA: hypothetical protein VNT01_10235, partial [Symbiobacteriaceae bacterium]|nr:hypothetical protein [Symbiobacteriaceae bacterium]